MGEVKLLGEWSSPFSFRVICALKLKGIPYEYIEEDLCNKSPLLLHCNPVHKKIPVLIHGGNPVCESAVILQYIEETWPENPLLPVDPYERALARFWIKFADEKGPAIWMMFCNSGEEQEKVRNESLEMMKTIEEKGGLGEKKFFGGDQINLVDIAFGFIAHWLGVFEEIIGMKLIGDDKFPRLDAWITNFKEVPAIKESIPDRDKMLVLFRHIRESFSSSL